MKFIKYIIYTFLIIIFNMILLIIIAPDFRLNLLKYFHRENFKIGQLFKASSDSTDTPESEEKSNSQTLFSSNIPSTNLKQTTTPGHKKNTGQKTGYNRAIEDSIQFDFDKSEKSIPPSKIDKRFQIVEKEVTYISKNDGILFIESTPKNGIVWIENQKMGLSPLTIRINPPGIYRIKVTDNYLGTWEKPIKIYPSEVTKVKVDLKPGNGVLTILSDPQHARVWINSDFKGTTPLTIKPISTGIHHIHLSKNELEYEGKVEIITDQRKTMDIKLDTLRSKLTIHSKPSEANIYIDGLKYGKTPAEIEKVKIGTRQIILTKGKELAYVDSVYISRFDKNDLDVTLENKSNYKEFFSANLKVYSEIEEAYVRIDGLTYGETPQEIKDLHIGEHEIILIKPLESGSLYYVDKLILKGNENKEILIKKESFKFQNN
jgi:hypothetical protein